MSQAEAMARSMEWTVCYRGWRGRCCCARQHEKARACSLSSWVLTEGGGKGTVSNHVNKHKSRDHEKDVNNAFNKVKPSTTRSLQTYPISQLHSFPIFKPFTGLFIKNPSTSKGPSPFLQQRQVCHLANVVSVNHRLYSILYNCFR